MTLFHRRVCEEGMAMEMVFREEMYRELRDSYPERTTAVATAEQCLIYTVDDAPFGLFVLDADGAERACLVVYGADRNLRGIIVNDHPKAVAWATRIFERYRSRATPVGHDRI